MNSLVHIRTDEHANVIADTNRAVGMYMGDVLMTTFPNDDLLIFRFVYRVPNDGGIVLLWSRSC
jgi:hypothetical protein